MSGNVAQEPKDPRLGTSRLPFTAEIQGALILGSDTFGRQNLTSEQAENGQTN